VVAQAKQHAFNQVTAITLSIGALSCIEPEALTTGIQFASRDTIAEGAKLNIETVPATAWCSNCEKTVAVQSYLDGCPQCHGYQLLIETGEELKIKHIEVA